MTKAEVRAWHAEHGIPYITSDWTGSNFGLAFHEDVTEDPDALPVWTPRTPEEAERLAAVEDILAPYVSKLRAKEQRVIDDLLYWGISQRDLAAEMGLSQSAVARRLQHALRNLVRLMALDDKDYPSQKRRGRGRPSRDLEEELAAAQRTFNRRWRERFGSDFAAA